PYRRDREHRLRVDLHATNRRAGQRRPGIRIGQAEGLPDPRQQRRADAPGLRCARPHQPTTGSAKNAPMSNDAGGFRLISATALKSAISGSIFAEPDACFVMITALPLGSTFALPAHHAIRRVPPCHSAPSASFRSAVLIAPVSFQPCDTPTIISGGTPAATIASTIEPIPCGSQPIPSFSGSSPDS